METDKLIRGLKGMQLLVEKFAPATVNPERIEEIVQKLREYDELKKLAGEAVDPLIELYNYLLGVFDFQEGDINYGRKE